MHYLVYVIFFGLYGIYLLTIGFDNLTSNQKHLDILAIVDIKILRILKGAEAADRREEDLLSEYKHRILSRGYFITGLGSTVVAVFIFLDNI